jgi:uncharacterized protein YjbK
LGIEEFLKGLAIDLKGDDYDRGKRIQDKMASNYKMASDRMKSLSKIIRFFSYFKLI